MESRTLRSITISLISALLIFVNATATKACVWIEDAETYRISMFRAQMSGMEGFMPFWYSAKYLNSFSPDPSHYDWARNCSDWQKALGNDVKVSDIDVILYKTTPDLFIKSFTDNQLSKQFDGNTFIAKLVKKENKDFLEYLMFAKQVEFLQQSISDPWGEADSVSLINKKALSTKLLSACSQKVALVKNDFLKARYAFQLVRMYHYTTDYKNCIKTFDTYFAKAENQSILYYWAMQFKALSLDNLDKKIEANYLYSLVFNHSDEKKVRVYFCFNTTKDAMTKTLALAKNDEERAGILSLYCFRFPGRTLNELKQIFQLSPNHKSFSSLVMREINKLEDWLITPSLTGNGPAVNKEGTTYDDYMKKDAREKNFSNDVAYLREVRSFLTTCYDKSSGEQRDFLSVAIAHLYFIDDNAKDGLKYLASIPSNTSASILQQKDIDELLVNIYTGNLKDDKLKDALASKFISLEKSAAKNRDVYKTLYSLVRKLSDQFEKQKDIAPAGLLLLKSEYMKRKFEGDDNDFMAGSYYWKIGYFDERAKYADMDVLIELSQKKNKSVFEQYIGSQLYPNVNAYRDLKGTIAFRMNDLKLAYKTFAEIADTFWVNNYEFKSFLNEDPFLPKVYPQTRNFKYQFNKTKFVKQLIDLSEEADKNPAKRGENYVKLGNAYFNCTYWGNSWMMFSYGWSSAMYSSSSMDYAYGANNRVELQTDVYKNYYECNRASDCYRKALTATTDKELLAKANFMLYVCDYNCYFLEQDKLDYEKQFKVKYTPKYVKELYTTYKDTKTFGEVRCSRLDDFATRVGVKLD